MATVEEVLKKLNKTKKEEDKHLGILGDRKIVREFVSTGSVLLDYVLGGGFAAGGYNTIVGAGSSGKSSIALLACKDVISKGKKAVYYDGEYTMNESYFERMDIDTNQLILEQNRNLEDMLDFIEAMSTANDVGIIIIDSIPIFFPTAVEAKSASQYSMADAARRYTSRMPIIEANCAKRNIALIGLTSYKTNPNAMGDPRYLPSGAWQITMNNVFLDIIKKDIILDGDKIAIGHKLDVRVKKTKTSTYNPKHVYTLDFYYDGGFNQMREYSTLFVKHGLMNKGGAGWVTLSDMNGEDVKIQGTDNLVEYFTDNPECFKGYKKMLDESFSTDVVPYVIDETVDDEESTEGVL